jgi:hypothetical protein
VLRMLNFGVEMRKRRGKRKEMHSETLLHCCDDDDGWDGYRGKFVMGMTASLEWGNGRCSRDTVFTPPCCALNLNFVSYSTLSFSLLNGFLCDSMVEFARA